MKTIKQKEFDELVELHQLWLEDNSKGKRLKINDCIIDCIICENKNLSYATFNYSKFYNSVFNDSVFNYSEFYDSIFNYSKFNDSRFNNSDFNCSEFKDSDFNYSEFKDSDFNYSKFNYSKFNNSDFRDSDFNYSKFNSSEFYDCIGNGKEIISMQFGIYKVVMLKGVIAIGCEQHTVKEWLSFTDKELESMDGKKGLDWWNRYSKIVFDLHKLHFGVEQ